MSSRIQMRTDTAAGWAARNPTLALGEPGWISDTKVLKMGDGATPFTTLLPFAGSGGGGGGGASSGIGAVLAEVSGAYPNRPATVLPVIWKGADPPGAGGTTAGGSANAVDNLDIWLRTP